MRRCRILGDNIVSFPPSLTSPSLISATCRTPPNNQHYTECLPSVQHTIECIHALVSYCKCCLYIHSDYYFLSVIYTDVKYGCMDLPLMVITHFNSK